MYFLPKKQACVKLTKTPTRTQYITLGMNKQEMSPVGQTPYEPTRIWNNTNSSTEEEFWSLSVYWVMMGTSNLSRKRARAKNPSSKGRTLASMWAEPQCWCGFRKALGSLALQFSKPRRSQGLLPGQIEAFHPVCPLLRFSFLDPSKSIPCPYFLTEEEKRL